MHCLRLHDCHYFTHTIYTQELNVSTRKKKKKIASNVEKTVDYTFYLWVFIAIILMALLFSFKTSFETVYIIGMQIQ